MAEVLGTPSFLNVGYINGYDATLATSALRARGCRRVGIVGPGGLLHALVSTLQAEFDCADATDLVDGIKAVKSAAEQVGIRAMAALQDDVFAAVLGAIRPGMRDVDVTALAQHTAQTLGSEQGIFIGSSARLGLASMFLPRHLQGRTIRAGDHFSLLIEVNGLGGFYGEIARTIVLGRASAELLDGFAAVREAQTHTLSLIRPGAVPAEIAAAHDAWMVARGLPPETRLYAHGQGYDMVERPLLRRDETLPIAEGMLLAIHPGYETPSLFAVIYDNYLVTATGASDCLHRTEKKVFELNV